MTRSLSLKVVSSSSCIFQGIFHFFAKGKSFIICLVSFPLSHLLASDIAHIHIEHGGRILDLWGRLPRPCAYLHLWYSQLRQLAMGTCASFLQAGGLWPAPVVHVQSEVAQLLFQLEGFPDTCLCLNTHYIFPNGKKVCFPNLSKFFLCTAPLQGIQPRKSNESCSNQVVDSSCLPTHTSNSNYSPHSLATHESHPTQRYPLPTPIASGMLSLWFCYILDWSKPFPFLSPTEQSPGYIPNSRRGLLGNSGQN